MKRLCIILVGVMFFMGSCENDSVEVSSTNIFDSVIPDDGIINEAEKSLGTLIKEERVFTDPSSGSVFKMVFAATSKSILQNFFEQNTIELKGVSEKDKDALLNNTQHIQISTENMNSADELSASESVSPHEVYYDLVYKNLKEGDIGLSFSIKQKPTVMSSSPSARLLGLDWRQQTSLPWCEFAILDMINEAPFPQSYEVLSQKRNWAWQAAGINYLITDGGSYIADTDDKKFYRFGGYNNVISKFSVTWYDLESGETRTSN